MTRRARKASGGRRRRRCISLDYSDGRLRRRTMAVVGSVVGVLLFLSLSIIQEEVLTHKRQPASQPARCLRSPLAPAWLRHWRCHTQQQQQQRTRSENDEASLVLSRTTTRTTTRTPACCAVLCCAVLCWPAGRPGSSRALAHKPLASLGALAGHALVVLRARLALRVPAYIYMYMHAAWRAAAAAAAARKRVS